MSCIFLIGFMASGKSTVGRALSREIGASFFDTDAEIEAREGMSIAEIFRQRGEAYFRRCESRVLEELSATCRGGHRVIATGGGLPCSEDNMSLMNRRGLTVYLRTTIDDIMSRVVRVQERPVFDRSGNREALAALLEKRERHYSRAALTVDSGNQGSPQRTAEAIARLLEARHWPGND
jgi:shikimate kinase